MVRRFHSIVSPFVAFLAVCLIAAASGPALGSVRENVYLAFGDSITAGFDDTVGTETPGYPSYLEQILDETIPAAVVVNAGVSAESTGLGLLRLPGTLSQQRPQFLLLMEGINDLRHGASAAAVAFNLAQMVHLAENRGTIPIIATILPDDSEVPRWVVNELNASIAGLSGDGTEIGLADAYKAMADRTGLFGGMHPNQHGYQVLAAVFDNAIRVRGTEPPPPYEGSQGDIDGNGRVDGWDLVKLNLAFGSQIGEPAYSQAADINMDGIVDGGDLSILAAHFGEHV